MLPCCCALLAFVSGNVMDLPRVKELGAGLACMGLVLTHSSALMVPAQDSLYTLHLRTSVTG